MIQITEHRENGGCRGYDSEQERNKDIENLRKDGYNYFTTYRDTAAFYALSYGKTPEPKNHWTERQIFWTPKPGDTGYDLMC